jgi:hypothetical protein
VVQASGVDIQLKETPKVLVRQTGEDDLVKDLEMESSSAKLFQGSKFSMMFNDQ